MKKFLPLRCISLITALLILSLAVGKNGKVVDRKTIALMGWDAAGKTFTASLIVIHLGQYRVTALDANDLRAQKLLDPAGGLDILKRIGRIYIDFEPDKRYLIPKFAKFTTERPLDFTFEVIDLLEGDPVGRFISFEDPLQREAKNYLTALAGLQHQYKMKTGKFAATFSKLDVEFHRKARYSYYLSPKDCVPRDACPPFPSHLRELSRYSSFKPTRDSFTIFAVANNDRDIIPDVWKVDQTGKLVNVINDVFR